MMKTMSAMLALALLCAGCSGYSTDPLQLREGVCNLAVPVFDNMTFWHDFEFELTDAVTQEVRARTNYRLVGTDEADLVLRGRIIDFTRPVLAKDERDTVTEGSVLVTVEITVEERATGKALVKKTLKENEAFVLARGENETSARAEAFEDLAENIVNLLEKDW